MADQTLSDRPSQRAVCPWCSAALVPGSRDLRVLRREPRGRGGPRRSRPDRRRHRRSCAARRSRPARATASCPGSAATTRRTSPLRRRTPQALAPPDPEVQREILRLELEAEVANLQAEADALLSEAVVEGRVAELPEDVQELATGEFDAETLAAATADERRAPAAADDAAPASTGSDAGRGRGRDRRPAAADDEAAARLTVRRGLVPSASILRTCPTDSRRPVRPSSASTPSASPTAPSGPGWPARPMRPMAGGWPSCGSSDDEGVVSFRDVAPAAGPPPDPPLGRLGPGGQRRALRASSSRTTAGSRCVSG